LTAEEPHAQAKLSCRIHDVFVTIAAGGYKETGNLDSIVRRQATAETLRFLERAGSAPFDVLVADRMLPGLDGLSLVAALRRDGRPSLFPGHAKPVALARQWPKD